MVGVCAVCAGRLRGQILSLEEARKTGGQIVEEIEAGSEGGARGLEACTLEGECRLCGGLFGWLVGRQGEEAMKKALEGRVYRTASLEADVSGTHIVREAMLLGGKEGQGGGNKVGAGEAAEALLSNLLQALCPAMQVLSREQDPSALRLTLLDHGSSREASFFSAKQGGGGGGGEERKQKRKKKRHGQGGERGEERVGRGVARTRVEKMGGGEAVGAALHAASQGSAALLRPPEIKAQGREGWLAGVYRKYGRNVPQSRWVMRGERIGASSVEERLLETVLPLTGGRGTLGAAGREDRDVRMIGSGRPFYLHLHDMHVQDSLEQACTALMEGNTRGKEEERAVEVEGMHPASKQEASAIDAAAQEKTKSYVALVRIEGRGLREKEEIEEEVWRMLEGREEEGRPLEVAQTTPVRVLHRRGLAVRRKLILRLRGRVVQWGSPALMMIELETSAGLYVKEWMHGDMGRTRPSLASLLRRPCFLLSLDVASVKLFSQLPNDNNIIINDDDNDDSDQ